MKTYIILILLSLFLVACFATWHEHNRMAEAIAFCLMIVILLGIGKSLINKL